jgi:5-methylcytosine-specific restriction endonuclease McrA
MAKKKKKPKYNKNSQIRSAIRRTFSRSPLVQEVKKDARTEHEQLKKDGTPAKRKAVRYKCAECGKLFMSKDIAIDHIEPVIPLDETFQTWDDFVERLFCDKNNLQVLCSYRLKDIDKHGGEKSCHHKKTQLERQQRKKLVDK